jgi:Tol biopolymer transport system component
MTTKCRRSSRGTRMKWLLTVLSFSLIAASCRERHTVVSNPIAPTPPIVAPNPPIYPPESWKLTASITSVTPHRCWRDLTGLTSDSAMIVHRAEAMRLFVYWDPTDGIEYLGSLSGQDFSLVASFNRGNPFPLGCQSGGGIQVILTGRVSGRFSDDGRSLSAEEVATYLVVGTGEQVDIRSRWAATAPSGSPPDGPPSVLTRPAVAFVSDRSGSDRIYVANADGSGATDLASGTAPAWSWDGQQVAFSHMGTVYVMNADGSNHRPIVHGYSPGWSPDSRKIVFVIDFGFDDDGRLFAMNIDGSERTEIFRPATGHSAYHPNWSPDGRRISFINTSYDDPWQVMVVNADGSEPRSVYTHTTDSGPRWSPDGQRILFSRSPTTIDSVDLNGVLRLETGWSRYIGDADWLPDGSGISYNRFTGPPDGRSHLGSRMRIFVLSGGVERQLIPEATSSALASYWDQDAVWTRTR